MILRAWQIWATLVVLASGRAIGAKPPELPTKPAVDGTATPVLTQNYYQPVPLRTIGPSRDLAAGINPPFLAPPAAISGWSRLFRWFVIPF